MKRLTFPIALLLTLINLLLPLSLVKADMGPKPTMQFNFKFQGHPIAILGGQQLECEDSACVDGKPLRVGGPMRFYCTADSCGSLAYGYKPYNKLVIQFADRTRESNVFQKRSFSAVYDVTVTESGLQIEETFANVNLLPALIFTLVVETIAAGVYLVAFRLRRGSLKWVPLASLISLPIVWFFILRSPMPALVSTGIAEGFAVLFEAVFIYALSQKALSPKHAFMLSLVMNATSFLLPFCPLTWGIFPPAF
jgi:hypothetical protein